MIGIIGAMEEEVAALKSEMADAKVTEFASMTFYKGTLCGKDTVVVRSGIGKLMRQSARRSWWINLA